MNGKVEGSLSKHLLKYFLKNADQCMYPALIIIKIEKSEDNCKKVAKHHKY